MRWVPIMPSRGVNLFDAPEALGDDECLKAKNLIPVPPGKLSKRGGLDRPFTAVTVGGSHNPVSCAISPLPRSTSDVVVFIRVDTGLGSILTGISIAGQAESHSLPFDAPRPWLLSWNGRVYVLPGPYAEWEAASEYPFYVFDLNADIGATTPAVTPLALAGAGNGNVYPTLAFPYKQRLVLANFGKGYENTIVFTDNFTADVVGDDVLSANGRAINLVAGADGDEIVAGIEVMLTSVGSPAEAGLLILRKYGNPFLLTGDMDQTTGGTSTLDVKRISVNCGCAGQYTVARTPHGIIWAGVDDVWAFREGVIPFPVGTKIRPALKLTPVQLQYRWSGAYFDGFYRLAVWGEGQGMAATDAPGDQWWLDLRDGLPPAWRDARWWGPQQFLGGASAGVAPRAQTWGLVAESRAGKEPRLFYVDRSIAAGAPSAVLGQYDTNPRDMTATAVAIPDADYVDPEVTVELVTKEMVLAPPHQQVNDGVMFSCHPSSNIQLNMDFVLDEGQYKYTTTKYMTAEGFLTGSSRLGTAIPFKKQQQVGMYPSNRRAAQQHRFKLYDQAGWSILTGLNDTLIVGVSDWESNPAQWFLTVPQGLYTISSLLAALNAANLLDSAGVSQGTLLANEITLALSSGKPRFDDSVNPSFLSFSLGFLGDQPLYWSSLIATAAQYTVARRLGAILGFDTTGDQNFAGDGSGSPVQYLEAAQAPFKKGVSRVELYGLQANFEVIPRAP